MSRQNREASISTKISQLSRRTFWPCQDFLNSQDALFDDVEIETLNRDMIETNRDLHLCRVVDILKFSIFHKVSE
jgi:hypothetical protein